MRNEEENSKEGAAEQGQNRETECRADPVLVARLA